MTCDGSGVMFEQWIDVDQTVTHKCPGCAACDEERAAEYEQWYQEQVLDEMHHAMWAGVDVLDKRPLPVMSVVETGDRKREQIA